MALAVLVPLAIAATSPLLQWRSGIYIAAGFAGVLGLALIFLQPLLAGGYLPGLQRGVARRFHKWTGIGLVLAVVIHVVGLWVTSPPDVIDALLFRSPTPFSAWGVVAMWAVFLSVTLVALKGRRLVAPVVWRVL
ncbi:MAG: ferric reductase-like transmembrane domain-containing protein, partial [Pseudomonadota bacterium]